MFKVYHVWSWIQQLFPCRCLLRLCWRPRCTVGKMANLAPINSNFKIYNGAKTVLYSITNTSDRSLIFFILFCSQYSFSCKASKTTYVAPAVAKNFPSLFNNQLQFLIKFVGVTVKFFLVFLIKAKGMY